MEIDNAINKFQDTKQNKAEVFLKSFIFLAKSKVGKSSIIFL